MDAELRLHDGDLTQRLAESNTAVKGHDSKENRLCTAQGKIEIGLGKAPPLLLLDLFRDVSRNRGEAGRLLVPRVLLSIFLKNGCNGLLFSGTRDFP